MDDYNETLKLVIKIGYIMHRILKVFDVCFNFGRLFTSNIKRQSENVFWSPADVLCPDEYIMTNTPWSGLGTEDWTVCRFEFIFLDILAVGSRYSPKNDQILLKGPYFLWWHNTTDKHPQPRTKWRDYIVRRLCWLEEIQIHFGKSVHRGLQ